MAETRTLPTSVLCGEVSALLAEGKKVELKTKGASMRPFIEGDRDSVVLERRDSCKVGDIVLAQIRKDVYVLHRVFAVDGDSITLMGDGNVRGTEHCKISDICGTVTTIITPKRSIKPGSGRVWRLLLPVRRYLLFIYRLFI